MRPVVSVVVPVYGNWWMTARALGVLDRLRGGTPFETIVVDNASTDDTPREIRRFPWVRYLRYESNRNFAGACNAGAAAAEAGIVLFLNNDAYPLGDAFEPLVRAFDREDVAIAGGALFFEDGVTQCAGFVVLPNAHWHYAYRNLPAELPFVGQRRDALGVSGAAMAVRRSWFLDGGGFDESYVNGFEDVDLCMRAREQARAIVYVPAARFAHYEGASAGRYDREADNERRFYERWSAQFRTIPRVARGEVGAIAIHRPADLSPFSAMALADLEEALRAFGHPLLHAAPKPWQRFDRRFRRSGTLEWFTRTPREAAVGLESDGGMPVLRVRGGADVEVPWLPCAARSRIATLPLRASLDPACTSVVEIGNEPLRTWPNADVACVVVRGLTDEAAFGNVLLAQAGIPAIVANRALRSIYAGDVALFAAPGDAGAAALQLAGNVEERRRYGRLIAADAGRRFSPRRTAIRVVDLLCASRFGFERPARARSNAPFER
jgi:GT2 family glycosyltransferase